MIPPAHQSRYADGRRRPFADRCRFCGASLAALSDRSRGLCRSPRCRQQADAERAADDTRRREQQRNMLRTLVGEVLSEAEYPDPGARATVAEPLVIVPGFHGQLAAPSPQRREQFRATLQSEMTRALSDVRRSGPEQSDSGTQSDEPADEPPSLLIMNACATCGGECCRHGRDDAFLRAPFLARRLQKEPDREPQDIIDNYLDRIPAASFEDSCLYHTPTGCALPRTLRSTACNEFLCRGLREGVRERSDASDPADAAEPARTAGTAVAVNYGIPERVGVCAADGRLHLRAIDGRFTDHMPGSARPERLR